MTGPLAGRTVLVTRPRHQAAALERAIEDAGGRAYLFPALDVEAVPITDLGPALDIARGADIVVFISPNAAQFGTAALASRGGLPAHAAVFAVGPGTARALAAEGVDNVTTPAGQDSEALLALPALADVAGRRVVIVRGVGGRPLLADTLRVRGAEVSFLECYRRVRPEGDPAPLLARWREGGIDAVTVTSAETLQNLAELVGAGGRPLLLATPLFAPHEKIADAARRFGVSPVVVTAGGDAGLVAGLINWFRNTP